MIGDGSIGIWVCSLIWAIEYTTHFSSIRPRKGQVEKARGIAVSIHSGRCLKCHRITQTLSDLSPVLILPRLASNIDPFIGIQRYVHYRAR